MNRRKGTAPEYPRVRNLANALCTLPPGFGMSSKAIPSNTAVVAYGYNDGSQAPFCDQDTVYSPAGQAHRSRCPQGRDKSPGRVRVHGHDADHIAQSHNSYPGTSRIPPVRMISVCPRAAMSSGKEERRRFLKFPSVKKSLLNMLTKTMRAARNTYMITVCPCLCQKFRFNLPFTLSHLPSCSFPVPCPAA